MNTARVLAAAGVILVCLGCSSSKPPPPLAPARTSAQSTAAQAAKLSQAGNWSAAAAQWSKAADQHRLLNDLPRLAVALHNLGQAQKQLGDVASARAQLERAAQLNKSLGRETEWWRNQIALLQLEAMANQETAVQTRLDNLAPQTAQLRDPNLVGLFLNEQGLRQTKKEQPSDATETFRQAEEQFRLAGNSFGIATVQANRAQLFEQQRNLAAAVEEWRGALSKFEALADPARITHALAGQGRSLLEAGTDLGGATEMLERAADNYRTLGDRRTHIEVLKLLERAHMKRGDSAAAERVATQWKQLQSPAEP